MGRWHGHLVRISDLLVLRIREDELSEDSALLVGPDAENPGLWITTTVSDEWMTVPQVRVWYHYEDFVTYVKQVVLVECAACAEGEALANGKHFIDTGSANSGVIMKGCPISRVEFNKMFGVTE